MGILKVELLRVLKSRATHIAAAALFLSLVTGVFGIRFGTTMASMYIAKQVFSACLSGSVIFALLTLYELNRVPKYHSDAIIDSVISPVKRAVALQFAVTGAAFIITALLAVIYLPYAVLKLENVFSLSDYALCFLLYIFPALTFGSLAASVFFNITKRADVSALGVVALLVLVLGQESFGGVYNYLLQWHMPPLPALSDDFSNAALFRVAAYSRILWLAILGGAWILSLCFVRRYGKGALGSFFIGARRVWPVALSAVMLVSSAFMWRFEPFFDRSPVDWMAVENNNWTEGVFLEKTHADIDLTHTFTGRLEGKASYLLRNETESGQDIYLNLNTGYDIKRVTANGQEIPFEDLKNDFIASREVRITIPDNKAIELSVEYAGRPQEWNISQNYFGSRIISGRSILLAGLHLVPSFSVELDAEAPITMNLTLPANLKPVTSGYTPELLGINPDSSATWFASDKGEDGFTLFAGDYIKADLGGGGMPIEFHYSEKHSEQLQGEDAVSVMEEAVRFCTEHYGPRAFTDDRPFKIVQGSELIFGGFARQNISTMSEESFTVENLRNTDIGANGAEVLAHEIIHQWWGLGAMFADPEDPYWSSEGITTYTTYRLLKELRGEDYANEHYRSMWEAEVNDMKSNFYIRHSEFMDKLPEAYRAELESRLESVNLYSGYALMFCRAAELLGGEDKLDAVLAKLYVEGGTEMPPEITLNDFLSASGLTREELLLD